MALRDLDIEVDIEVNGGELERVNHQANDLIDTLEKLDKTYRIDIDLYAAPALVELERIDNLMKELDGESLDIIARFDDNTAIEQMTALRSIVDDETLKINVDVDDNAALEKVNILKHHLENDKLEMKLDLDISDAEGRLAVLAAEMQAIEMNAIHIDIDSAGAAAQIAVLHAQLLALQTTTFDINVSGADVAVLQAQIIALQAQLDSLNNNPPDIDIHTQATQAIGELSRIESRIHDLNAEDIFLNVDIDNLSSDILSLRSQIHAIEASGINVNMDTAGAHVQLAVLQAHLESLRAGSVIDVNVSSGGFDIGSILNPNIFMSAVKVTTLAIALPALISVAQVAIGVIGTLGASIGILAGGALALGSALAIGAGGIVGFGAVAVSSISALYQEGAKLTSQQQLLKVQTDKVAASWDGLKDALQPTVLSATTSGVKAINTLLDQGHPILKNAGTAVDGLMDSLNKSLKGNEMQDFFAMLKRDVGPITTNLGNGLGNALKGVANTMTAFSPLTNWAAQGFENAMGRFNEWTAGLKDSDGLKTFMKYIEDNLPKIGSGLKDAAKGVGKFFAAFDITASEGLDWFKDTMKDFSKWSEDLGENEGFQDLLKDIKNDGPEVAKIIGNVTENVLILSSALSGLGKDENGEGGILSWLGDITNSDFLKDFKLTDIFEKGALGLGLDALGIDIDWSKILGFDKIGELFGEAMNGLGKWFDDIEISVGDWFKDLDFGGVTRGLIDDVGNWFSKIDIGKSISEAFGEFNFDLGSIKWGDFIPDFKWPDFGKFDFKSLVPDFKWPDFSGFSFKELIPDFKWPSFNNFNLKELIPEFKWPTLSKFSWGNFINKFSWSGITSKLNWGSFVKSLNWGSLVSKISWGSFVKKISWGSFVDKLSWNSIVKKISWGSYVKNLSWSGFVKQLSWGGFIKSINWSDFIPQFSWGNISMPDLSKYIPKFDTGIGRIPNDMTATVHKDEAILPASQASLLRDVGVIKGEGRYPVLDMNALATNNADTTAPTINADMSAIANYQPAAASSNPKARVSSVNKSASDNSKKEFNITINVDGSKSPEQTGASVLEQLQSWVASLEDANPSVYEF